MFAICKPRSTRPGSLTNRVGRVLTALFLACTSLAGAAAVTERSLAADPAATIELRPTTEPLDVNVLQAASPSSSVVTSTTISTTGLTIPSLWWVREQYVDQQASGDKLLENWIAYPSQDRRPGRVDFVVNRQFWSLLNYLDRYTFLHKFGTAASSYGYNLRVFDNQATLVAAYTCDFRAVDPSQLTLAPVADLPCSILLDSSGKAGFRGQSSSPLGGGSSNDRGTAAP